MNSALLISLTVTVSAFMAFVGLFRWLYWTRELEDSMETHFAPAAFERGMQPREFSARLNQRLSETDTGANLRRQLSMADLSMTVAEYMILRAALVVICFVAGWLVSGQIIGGVMIAGLGWVAPKMWLRRRQEQRRKQFNDQLMDVLNLLVGSLRAGYGLGHALSVVVEEMPKPASSEFQRVLRETWIGYSMDDALKHLVERVQSDDLELMVTSIQIQSEVGGNLADVLEVISQTIQHRIRLLGEVRSLTAQQRYSGSILTGLPFALGAVLMLMNPDYMMEIFQPGWPLLIPATAVVMSFFGYVVMQRMLHIEV